MNLISCLTLLFQVLFKMFIPIFIAFIVIIFLQFICYRFTGISIWNEYVKLMKKQIRR